MKSKKITTSSSSISLSAFPFNLLFSLRDSAGSFGRSFGNSRVGLSSLKQNDLSKLFKKILPPVLLLGLVVVVILVVKNLLQNALSGNFQSRSDTRVEIRDAKAKTGLNKDFYFSVRDEKGKEATKIKYTLDSAELRDEIVVKGQKATAVKGRTYLILTIKLTNSFDKAIKFDSLNYVRLSVNGNKNEWIAADIYNDPILIQPQSTKMTRLGFPINDTDRNLILRVGEVEGSKKQIPIKF